VNTLSDIVAFNREHASRHIDESSRGWWYAGIVIALCFVLSVLYLDVWAPDSAAQHINGLAATVNTR
jgi:H+/Cl- antiporter ClcA